MNKRQTTDSMGFTLIEVLIAIAVFSIGVLAVGAMQVSSVKDNAIARGVTAKASLAADRMEKLLALPYNDTALQAGTYSVASGSFTEDNDGIDNDNDGQIDESGESGFITISWTIQDDTPLTGTKTVDVTVTRTSAFGGQRRVTLTSIKADL